METETNIYVKLGKDFCNREGDAEFVIADAAGVLYDNMSTKGRHFHKWTNDEMRQINEVAIQQ